MDMACKMRVFSEAQVTLDTAMKDELERCSVPDEQ